LAAGIFGTSTPYVSTRLIEMTHQDKASPAYWLMFAAALGILATLTVYRGGRTIETREAVTA
jgi:MHS family citrate/tricarballylate:H+ symporter-like MFS transporter